MRSSVTVTSSWHCTKRLFCKRIGPTKALSMEHYSGGLDHTSTLFYFASASSVFIGFRNFLHARETPSSVM